MKLINIEDEPLLKTVSVGGLSAKALWRLIKSQRTIKAIPIEYIQKWNNNYIADTMRDGRTIINQMLEDWGKENE